MRCRRGASSFLTFHFSLCASILLLAGCLAPSDGRESGLAVEAPRPKRVVVAITGDPPVQSNKLNPGNLVPGLTEVEQLVHVSLTRGDSEGNTVARLAEAVPSLENGLWRTSPDGRMEVTWKLRSGPEWHDGAPFTVEDLLFTIQVGRDREIPALRSSAFLMFDSAEAVDSRTVLLRYAKPFIEADSFSYTPFPKHVLEPAYLENKATFTEHSYFHSEFFGTGPFRIREWVRNSHVVLAANDRYFLGRPKIDEIEVRFIVDQNTLVANVLAGTVELLMSRGLSLDQGMTIRQQWREGQVVPQQSNIVAAYPQFVNPDPVIVTDLRFRRGLLHALDRQSLADTIYGGLVTVPHLYLNHRDSAYPHVDQGVRRYDYDPRRAIELIQSTGATRASDGGFRDAAGQPIKLPVRSTTTRAERTQMLFALLEAWQQIGLGAEADIAPPQVVADREYQSVFPALQFTQRGGSQTSLRDFHSSAIPLPENRWQGNNIPRYSNPELDSLIDRFNVTIPVPERNRVVSQILHHIADQLPLVPVVYGMDIFLITNRLRNVGPESMPWNAHEWEVV